MTVIREGENKSERKKERKEGIHKRN